MFRKFIKDSIIYTIPSLLSRSTSFFLIPLYTRILNPSTFGSFDLFLIFTNLINLTISLEITQAVARFYVDEESKNKKRLILSTSFWFTIFCYLFFLLITFYFSIPLSKYIMGDIKFNKTFQFGLIYIFFTGIYYFIQNQLRWDLKSIEYSILSAINAILTIFFTFILCNFLHFGLDGIIFSMILSSIISLVYGLYILKNDIKFIFSNNLLKNLLKFSIPLVFSSLSVYISNYIGRILITKYSSLTELGVYAIAFRISSIIGLVMTGIQTSLSPLIYSHHKEKDTPEVIAKIFRYFVFTSLLVSSILIIYSNLIVNIFSTKDYFDAEKLLIFLIPSILFSQMYIFAPGIGIAKKTIYYIWINLVGAILSIILNYILIINFGIQGASIANLLVYFILFIIYMILSQSLYYVPHEWNKIFLLFTLSFIVLFFFKYFLINLNLLFGVLIPFLLFIIVYKIKFFKKEDLSFLKFKIKY